MKKLLFAAACTLLVAAFAVLPAQEVEAAEPCTWAAVIQVDHALCGPVEYYPSGYSSSACQANIQWWFDYLNNDPLYSNPVLTTACRPVSGTCPKTPEPPAS